MTHSLAKELNDVIQKENPRVLEMLSSLGKELYFPKGILTQSAEAKQKAKKYNATIGIARENGQAMHLPCMMKQFNGFTPDEVFSYAPSPGNPELRAEWQKHVLQKNPSLAGKTLSLPVVTCGLTHGLSLAADMFVDKDDVVLIPDQVWGNYNMVFGVCGGGGMKRYRFFSDQGGFDVDGFKKTLLEHSPRGKLVVILNFPNNPTGYTVSRKEAQGIADALVAVAEKGCNVVAVFDDAYFGLFYEDETAKESIFTLVAQKHPRLLPIKLDGATKEDYVWGFRVGFITYGAVGGAALAAALEKKTGGCVRGAISNDSQLSQAVVLKAMKSPSYAAEKQEKYLVMKNRYEKVKAALARPEYADLWTPYPFNSGYFMCVRLKKLNAEEYRLGLLETHGIGVIATAPTDIRVAFSSVEGRDIDDLFAQMAACARQLAGNARAQDMSLHQDAFEE